MPLQPPRPTHFLVRPTGEIVPVVAVDEFPPGTNIVGVPRTIGIDATGGMLNLGLVRKREGSGYYAFKEDVGYSKPAAETVTQATTGQEMKNNRATTSIGRDEVRAVLLSSSDEEDEGLNKRSVPPTPRNTPNHSPSSSFQQNVALSGGNHNASHHPNTQPRETMFCRHWCRHGNCKWGPQCHYKHVMPMTLPGLIEVGLRDWPIWYRSLNPGYFVDSSISLARPPPRNPVLRNPRRVGGGRRGAIDNALGEEIIQKLREKEIEREAEKDKRHRVRQEVAAEHEKKDKDARRRVAEERKAREEVAAKGMAVQRAVESGARRWADEDSSDDESVVEKEVVVDNKVTGKLVDL